MQSLRKGIAAAKSGDKARARRILEQIIQTDNRNVAAWLWLASVVERKKAVQCLEYVLKIDPTNLPAKAGLAQLTSSASTPQSELVEASSQPEPAAVPRIPPQFEVDNSPKPTATASVPDDVVVGEQQVLADKRAGSSITTGLRESAGLVVLVVCILLAAGIIVGVSLATQSRTPQIVYVTATPNLTSREDAATAISLAEELTPQADTVASVPTTDLLPHLASGGFIVAPAPLTVTVSPCEPFAQPFTIVRRRDISTNRCSGHLEFSGAQVVRRLYEDVLSKQSDVGSAATLLLSVVSYDGVGYDNIDAFCKLGDSVPVQSDSARVTDFTAADGSQFTEVVDKFTDGVSERLVLDYDLLDSEGWPRGGGNSMTDESRQFQTSSDLVGYSIDLIRRDVTHLSLPTTADEKGYSFNVTWSFWEYPEYSDLRWMWIGPAFIDLKVFQTQQVTVTFDAGARMPGGTALSPGIYTSTIVIDPGEDCVSPILLPVTMIVSDESCYELAEAPTPTPPNPTPSPTPTSPFTPFPTPDFDDGTWISSGKTPTPTPIPVPTATPPGEDISDPNYVWGKEAYQAEDYEQVLRLMTLVLKDDPNLAPPYWYRGMAYYYLGDYETGLEEMEKALELNTTYALAYADRGLMYSKLGDETRAFADWDVALGLDPTLAKVHHNMGVIYFNRSEYDLALEAYNAALVIDPMRAVTWVNHAETLIELGNPNCAESADRAIELQPDLWVGYFDRARCKAMSGDYRGAVADMDIYLAADPHNPRGWYNRGRFHRGLGKSEQAIADYTRALELDPTMTWALINRGQIYREEGELELAYVDHAEASLYQYDYDGAIGNASTALRYAEESESDNVARILLIRGRAYYGTGDYWKALNDLSQVIETQPTPMAFYYRGITYQANGMEERAIQDLEIFLEQTGDADQDVVDDASARLSMLQRSD